MLAGLKSLAALELIACFGVGGTARSRLDLDSSIRFVSFTI